MAKALSDHQANINIHKAMSQVTFRDDVFGDTGATLDDFSVFTHKAAIELSGSVLLTMGSWLDAATTETQIWFFQAGHHLSPQPPNDETGFDVYHVDFNATSGMNNRWHTGLASPVIYPDRTKEDRRLLTYTSAPLARDLEITGYLVVTLYVASTEEDGAFFVYGVHLTHPGRR